MNRTVFPWKKGNIDGITRRPSVFLSSALNIVAIWFRKKKKRDKGYRHAEFRIVTNNFVEQNKLATRRRPPPPLCFPTSAFPANPSGAPVSRPFFFLGALETIGYKFDFLMSEIR